MSTAQTVSEWLTSVSLPQYLPSFSQSGYDDLEVISRLTESDLDNIGIIVPGHRKSKKDFFFFF
jgi:hypothetical protein